MINISISLQADINAVIRGAVYSVSTWLASLSYCSVLPFFLTNDMMTIKKIKSMNSPRPENPHSQNNIETILVRIEIVKTPIPATYA